MKEQSDNREREYKFTLDGDVELVLRQLRPLVRPGWALVTFPPQAVMDIYFDTPDRDLLPTGSTLRMRKRRINPGWTMNYKSPLERGEVDFVDRREVITRVTIADCLQYRHGWVPGLAWACAQQFLTERGISAPPVPVSYLVTWRTGWTIRTGDLGDRQANYLYLFHDATTAYDLGDQRPEDIIRYGALHYGVRSPVPASFEGYEIESSGLSVDDEMGAVLALRHIAKTLDESPRVTRERRNKYQIASALSGGGPLSAVEAGRGAG